LAAIFTAEAERACRGSIAWYRRSPKEGWYWQSQSAEVHEPSQPNMEVPLDAGIENHRIDLAIGGDCSDPEATSP
jgi:hypothetical protein